MKRFTSRCSAALASSQLLSAACYVLPKCDASFGLCYIVWGTSIWRSDVIIVMGVLVTRGHIITHKCSDRVHAVHAASELGALTASYSSGGGVLL